LVRSLDPPLATRVSSTRASAALRARLLRGVVVSALALLSGACSMTYPLSGEADDIKTGSIDARPVAAAPQAVDAVTSAPLGPPSGAKAAPPTAATPAAYAPTAPQEPPALTPSDWAYARGALSIAMAADATNASVPWANPDSGAYGAFSAAAGATNENGATCRLFTASHSAAGHEQRLEGTACRTAAGYWEAVAIRTAASRTL